MNQLKNFVNRSLCEYQSIFPNVASVLDHLFFTIGNGYDVDPETGMLAERGYDEDKDEPFYKLLSDWPELDDKGWNKLIAKCHAKAVEFNNRHREMEKEYEFLPKRDHDAELIAAKAKFQRMNVEDSAFSAEELYEQLRDMNRARFPKADSFLRPYPLSTQYSDIYNLNENSPPWLVQIAINLCKAWVKFLAEEIKYEHVYKVAPTPLKGEQFIGSGSDYANMEWTTKHHDMLVELLPKLQALHDSHFNFKARDKVVVARRDPLWVYCGCAEPMPGMKGTIVKDKYTPEGKVAVSFSEKTLGYERSDKGNLTIFVNPAILEMR